MYKINEIFHSLQGEGYHTGSSAVFVRFSGCNLKCPFCDTEHEEGELLTAKEIAEEINRYPAPLVVLTGGEPSLFIDEDFVNLLKKKTHKTIAIETNGTRRLPQNIDWITLSPKDQFQESTHLPIVLDHCDELKVIFPCPNLSAYDGIRASHRFLQPCDVNDAQRNRQIIQEAIRHCMENPRWRLSMQMHKILGVK
ncbi:MAG: radical SAM protein [Bacteroidaceae bacterium]|nr:radical SAM protein [Bacteroidaceae bacterium]